MQFKENLHYFKNEVIVGINNQKIKVVKYEQCFEVDSINQGYSVYYLFLGKI